METPLNPLISARTLSSHGQAIVLDARDRPAYREGHWPGAIHLDIKHWERIAKSTQGGLERIDIWSAEIGALGIDGQQPVVVYDDARMTEAARAWFILQLHGVDVRVLDGGWPALCRLPQATVEQLENAPDRAVYKRPPGHVPRVGLVSRQELLDKLDGGTQVLDARSEAEHRGQDLRSNARGGHLPGAKWLAHGSLLNEEGTLKSAQTLRARLADAGVASDAPIVTHCDAGGRAALAALAAVVAGQRDVSTYYLSFSDWAADGSCPVVQL
jgi:thiosulfate/3-mercaptopyruvate sulfurtransferase